MPTLEIEVSQKLLAYLKRLAALDHGFGSDPEAVALGLIWRQIEIFRGTWTLAEVPNGQGV